MLNTFKYLYFISIDNMEDDLDLKNLRSFIGTNEYHDVMGSNVTDGIAYIMNNGYSWFVTDTLAVITTKFKNKDFLGVKLKLDKNDGAKMIIENGDGKTLYEQKYKWTNAKKELMLFWTNNVLMLSTEY